MAGLTKDELKSALIAHGVEQNLSAAKKDELVELYEEFVAPHDEKAGEFSSDDENLTPVTRSSRYRSDFIYNSKTFPQNIKFIIEIYVILWDSFSIYLFTVKVDKL